MPKFGNVDLIIGGQYGSEGKGKLAGYVSRRVPYSVAVCNFTSQAGHTFVYDEGRKVITQQLPTAIVSSCENIMIGPGAIIDEDVLEREINEYGLTEARLTIDSNAIVIDQRHKDAERANAIRVASTMKGNGAAAAEKCLRFQGLRTAGDDSFRFKQYVGDVRSALHNTHVMGGDILLEGSQGFDLDVNLGFYPFVTSRGTTSAAELSRCGLSPQSVRNVFGAYRTFPIRVGNLKDENGVEVGNSGPVYDDQTEMTWDELSSQYGGADKLLERTTVTGRVRRVFTFSRTQFARSIVSNGVNCIFINYANYIDGALYGASGDSDDSPSRNAKLLDWLQQNIVPVLSKVHDIGERVIIPLLIGTGPADSDMLSINMIVGS